MSRVTRGKLDVPQLRESRCPLTDLTVNGGTRRDYRAEQAVNIAVVDRLRPLRLAPGDRP